MIVVRVTFRMSVSSPGTMTQLSGLCCIGFQSVSLTCAGDLLPVRDEAYPGSRVATNLLFLASFVTADLQRPPA